MKRMGTRVDRGAANARRRSNFATVAALACAGRPCRGLRKLLTFPASIVRPCAADRPKLFRSLMPLLPHLTFLPRGYSETASDQWPLMLFLHGAGERGHDLRKLRRYGPPRIAESDPDFPFIVIAPQCPTGSYWRPPP